MDKLSIFNNEELLEVYDKIQEEIDHLNSNIIIEEDTEEPATEEVQEENAENNEEEQVESEENQEEKEEEDNE